MPENGDLRIDLCGELAGILNLCESKKRPASSYEERAQQIKMVAGARYKLNRLHSAFQIPQEDQWYKAPLAHLVHRPFY